MALVVVATDGSSAADAALEEAIALAREGGHRLAVVTVWQALQGDYGLAFPSAAVLSDVLDAERKHAETTLSTAAARVGDAGLEVETHLLTGGPAEVVTAFAKEHEARMIAVGTHGYGAVMSLLMGSVSSAIIQHAPCPVLVVRAPAADDDA